MRHTVIWSAAAEEDLALIWMQSADRDEVSRASDRIDPLLRTSPETKGEPHGEVRYLTIGPLRVIFEVLPDDYLVRVIAFQPAE
jgi:plasmid stabilization system protein ParE